jgi:hypothetical protein
VSNPSYLGQMKATMKALRMVTRLMTSGLAAGVGSIWTRVMRSERAGGSGIVPQKGS